MDQQGIKRCLLAIEQKLGWGTSASWTNHDFELLEEKIYQITSVRLSVTTLKRIWGKVDYQSKPSTTTLNVLAQYLGFEHWRDFQNNYKEIASANVPKSATKKTWTLQQKGVLVIILILALSSVFFLIDRKQVFFKSEEVLFESRKISDGLPNTVVFDYDVRKVIADSFHIQQSWDRRRRVRISPLDTQHTSFYYYPGFFHAKLIANDQIMKEHEVLVESNGWTGMIERFPEPIYLREMLTFEKGYLQATIDNYVNKDQHIQDKDFWIDYYYVDEELLEQDANNFEYECRIKNGSQLGSVCHESRISVMCTNGRFNIPLCEPGCVGNVNLSLGNKYLQGKRGDLSALGGDLNEWVDFRLKVDNKNCEIYINDEHRYSNAYSANLGNIAGFKFKFNGLGMVDYVRLKDSGGEIVFKEDFEYLL